MTFLGNSKSKSLAIAAYLLWMGAPAARADSLFSQGPPNGNNFDITDYRLADDFSLAQSATVDEIGFWYQAQYQTDLSAVTYAIYADNAGALGTVLQSGTINSPGTLRISDMVITGNGTGLLPNNGGQIISFRTNMIAGNGTDGAPSLGTSLK